MRHEPDASVEQQNRMTKYKKKKTSQEKKKEKNEQDQWRENRQKNGEGGAAECFPVSVHLGPSENREFCGARDIYSTDCVTPVFILFHSPFLFLSL
jgi:hypothetical protein